MTERELEQQQQAVNTGCAALQAAGLYGFCVRTQPVLKKDRNLLRDAGPVGAWNLVVISEMPQMFARGDDRIRWQIANKVTGLLRRHRDKIAAAAKTAEVRIG
jgi:hypothetical protein